MPGYLDRKINQVNSIIEFIEDPCTAPWSVYVRCAIKPLGILTLALLAFGMDDIVRGYFRPKGIYSPTRTGRRRGRGRLSRYARQGIPEIGEMVGKRLPGAKWMRARGVSAGVRAMWLVDGALQRVMFWWMIADVTTDFAYHWTTAVANTRECTLDRLDGAAVCEQQPTGCTREILQTSACRAIVKEWGGTNVEAGGMQTNRPIGVTAFGIHVVPWIDEPGRTITGVDVWIAYADNPWLPISTVNAAEANLDGSWDALVHAPYSSPKVTKGYWVVHGRNGWVTEGYIHGWCYKR